MGERVAGSRFCELCARMTVVTPLRVVEPEVERPSDVRLLQDPVYAARVESWLGNPRKLMDHRLALARIQALCDMLEDRVRRGGPGGMMPPPLLAALGELRQMHMAVGKLEASRDDAQHIHISLVNALVQSAVNVLAEYVPAERLPAALDKLRALAAHAMPAAARARATAQGNWHADETVVDDDDIPPPVPPEDPGDLDE
jgi:hypothetical protein